MSATLTASALTLGYSDTQIVDQIDLELMAGSITAIVGANACGKSTLLRGLARLIRPRSGHVQIEGENLSELGTKQVAQRLGLLPQSPLSPDGITVAELVGQGRHPHRRAFSRWTSTDDQIVADALAATGVFDLADRPVAHLSGGQRQRVWIALALAQQPQVLLLDEPTTFLDVCHQIEVLDLLTELNAERGTKIAMVLHDLNLAARYADNLVTIRNGEVYSCGPAEQVLTEESVNDVFGLSAKIITDPTSGRPLVLPLGRHGLSTPNPGQKVKVGAGTY